MKPLNLKILGWGASLFLATAVAGADGKAKMGALPKESPAVEVPKIKLPSGTQIPEDMKQLAESFQKQSQAYVAQQKELWKQAKGASAEERQRLLEQLKTTRQAFLDQTRDIRADIQERIKDLKVTIRDSRPQAAGASEAGGRVRHGTD